MSECRFCLSITVNGEPPAPVTTVSNGEESYIYCCTTCRSALENIGVEVTEGWP